MLLRPPGLEFSISTGHKDQRPATACAQPEQMVPLRVLDSLEIGQGEARLRASSTHVRVGAFLSPAQRSPVR